MTFDDKLLLTKMRIQQWYEYYNGKVYVSFSGGKDSTVLLDIVRKLYPEVVAVFNDTGLEFPEIKKFVKTFDNVIWLKPAKNYQQVVKEYGFAIISKEVAQKVRELKHGTEALKEIRRNGKIYKSGKLGGKLSKKWQYLEHAPFEISEKCCDILKKNPAKKFEKQTGLKPIVGVMRNESNLRRVQEYKTGCNAYDAARPISKPLSKWEEEDIWEYIKLNNLSYSKIYDMGYKRTGCAWCAFGVHMEKESRFKLLKKTHPKIWNYAINKMGLKVPLEYLNIEYGANE